MLWEFEDKREVRTEMGSVDKSAERNRVKDEGLEGNEGEEKKDPEPMREGGER